MVVWLPGLVVTGRAGPGLKYGGPGRACACDGPGLVFDGPKRAFIKKKNSALRAIKTQYNTLFNRTIQV